ncbi:uncharacterized protein ASPGLDRAFT_30591 [Aspergillus glaucus CBS 516.65]|uniref:Mid2 domain-containing protein n=1 Tax=Aspergillus glaucus CBS 516.65 TaxID=1160497 RepID=A0A1L9V3N2_ASPGL|nr:hypothetical protein ASPGLDRAFT_30591 [Aspergillus glaucus CBS 516.65]OJJ78530.1 hypothetical protein ASPGLDRAFT_30591 [Aspergillus glaucus CBS 516.65]
MKESPLLRPLLFLLVTLLISTVSAQTCYFVNGDVATDDVPCNTTASTSICCSKSDICLSNGLCYLQGSNGPSFSRGSCTNKKWSGVCANAKPCQSHAPQTGYRVVNALENQYCCGSVTSIDSSNINCAEDRAFYVAPGTVIPGVAALNASNSGNSADNNTDGDNSSSSSDDKSTHLAIGLGLGIPLGIIAGSALIWGAWERKQRAVSAKELQDLKVGAAAAAAGGAGMAMGGMAPHQYGYGYGVAPTQVPQPQFAQPAELEHTSSFPTELDSRTAARERKHT